MWCDYAKASPGQQAVFQHVNPQLGPGPRYERYQIWITRKGQASRRKGHWQWTAAYGDAADKAVVGALREVLTGECEPAKDDGARFTTATFHLDRGF